MKLIIGLGNPGEQYSRTRHNVGFLVIDTLIDYDRNQLVKGKGPFLASQRPFQNTEAVLVKPTIFMNESGKAVRSALEQFHVLPEECLIVVDDVNLPIGKIRFRASGSAGGHHGLESIIGVLGTEHVPRLRLGVGAGNLSGRDLTDYVLERFTKEEWELFRPAVEQARDACLEWLQSGRANVIERSKD